VSRRPPPDQTANVPDVLPVALVVVAHVPAVAVVPATVVG
jgi:hypothetical protein